MAEKAKMEVWGNDPCTVGEQARLEKKDCVQVFGNLKRTGGLLG